MTTEEELEALKETNKELVGRVSQLESINISLVDQKKELKQKLEDGSTDEALKAELTNYKEQLSQVEQDKADISSSYKGKLANSALDRLLDDKFLDVKDGKPREYLKAELLKSKGIEFNEDKHEFMFLNDDKTTKFNDDTSKEYSIFDKLNELKEKDNEFFFNKATGGGATDTTTAPTPQTTSITDFAKKMTNY